MRNTSPAVHTIRFRRWSRKAYAAFASIGRCVTIGCLRKSVADSSLSKQKAAGTAGHAGCGEQNPWEGETKGMENDIGIPPSSDTPLTNIFTELRSNEPAILEAHVASHVNTWEKLCAYTLKQEDKRNKRYGLSGIVQPSTSCIAPTIRTSFFIHELNPRMIQPNPTKQEEYDPTEQK